MIVRLTPDGPAQVAEGDVLTELSVLRPHAMSTDQGDATADDLIGEVDGDHAWIVVAELEARSGRQADPEWRQGFARMIEYARSCGWVSDDGRLVRAHIETETAP